MLRYVLLAAFLAPQITVGPGLPINRQKHIPGAATAPSACDNLISHWSMNEASGTRVDSVDSNDFSATGTVGAAAGKFGNASSWSGSSANHLDKTSATGLLPASFTVTLWATQGVTVPAIGHIALNVYDTGFTRLYEIRALRSGASPNYVWRVQFNAGGGLGNLSHSTVYASPMATFQFVQIWYDGASDTMFIRVDQEATASLSAGAADDFAGQTAPITARVGLSGNGVTAPHNGLIDEVDIFSGVKTISELDALYNQGNGTACQ